MMTTRWRLKTFGFACAVFHPFLFSSFFSLFSLFKWSRARVARKARARARARVYSRAGALRWRIISRSSARDESCTSNFGRDGGVRDGRERGSLFRSSPTELACLSESRSSHRPMRGAAERARREIARCESKVHPCGRRDCPHRDLSSLFGSRENWSVNCSERSDPSMHRPICRLRETSTKGCRGKRPAGTSMYLSLADVKRARARTDNIS